MFRVLDLFSGIGGFSLGLERTGGFRTVAFCEIDPFCRRVLAKHWPDVRQYEDVRELTADRLRADGISVDVICGGFPCQDISNAGKRVGIEGERSGLWSEYARIIGELRPRFAIVENVAAILGRGLDRVLGDLAAVGFDAEWHCIPASAVGAPHRRDRLWLVARPGCAKRRALCGPCDGLEKRQDRLPQWKEGPGRFAPSGEALADAQIMFGNGSRDNGRGHREGTDTISQSRNGGGNEDAGHSARARFAEVQGRQTRPELARFGAFIYSSLTSRGYGQWRSEPDVGRVAHGVPSRVDRLRSLGNAVVPQVVEVIGRAILAAEAERLAA